MQRKLMGIGSVKFDATDQLLTIYSAFVKYFRINVNTMKLWHYGAGVDSASNRNEYQEYFLGGKGSRCIGLTTLPSSCDDCLEIWEPQPTGNLWGCPGL
jgi:hypothetical protein